MADPTRLPPAVPARRGRPAVVDFCIQQPLGAISLVVILAMTFAGIFSEYVAPYDPLETSLLARLQPPAPSTGSAPTRTGGISCLG